MITSSVTPYHLIAAASAVLACEIYAAPFLNTTFMLPEISTILVIRIIEIALMTAINIILNNLKPQHIKHRTDHIKHLIKGIKLGLVWSLCFGLAALIGGVVILFITKTNPVLLFKSDLVLEIKEQGAFELAIFLFTGCIISPFAEELFFRGFIYSFARKYGFLTAITTSTLIFTLCHIPHSSTIPIIPLIGGVVFGLSYEHSKSLSTPIVIHSFGNSAIFILSMLSIR